MKAWGLTMLALVLSATLTAQLTPPRITGYVKSLPSVRFPRGLDAAFADHLLHNRLNGTWDINPHLHLHGSLRTRVFTGYTVENVPFYPDFVAFDDGFFNFSQNLYSGDRLLVHTISDRFFADFNKGKWSVRVGRQRINWGINTVSNPNDLFNTYSFFDFDYEERPGTDAVRVRYFPTPMSRVEVAYSPSIDPSQSVAAAMYAFNRKGFDFQVLSGYFRDRAAIGGGWAGHIARTGFKGEATWFTDLNPTEGRDPSNLVVAVSGDHLFSNGGFLIVEYLWSQPREGVQTVFFDFTQPLRPDNLSITDHSVFVNYTYPVSPIITLGAAGFAYPRLEGGFLSPNVNISARSNLDVLLISQLFFGPERSVLGQAGYMIATAVKWNF